MNKQKLTILTLSLAIAMLVSGCATKQTKNNQAPVNNPTQNQVATSSDVVASSSDEIDTSDWQTYKNDEYGFEVSIPKEYFDFGFGMESATQEEYNDAISSLINLKGTDIHNYIEINRYSREKIKEIYLKNGDFNALEFRKNANGVDYFIKTDRLLSATRINDSRIFCIGEKTDKNFICLYVRTEEKNYQQFFDKVISSYKKI